MLTLAFIITTFPYDDLSEFVTSKITRATNNQVYLQFNKLSLNILPTPHLKLNDIELLTPSLPLLKASSLSLSPSLLELLKFNLGLSVFIENLFGGNLSLTYAQESPDKENLIFSNMSLDVEDLSLKELSKTIALPINISGDLEANASGTLELQFKEQPDAEFSVSSDNIRLPEGTINAPGLGPVKLPGLVFTKLKLNGHLVDGVLSLNNVTLGSQKDDLQVQIKGDINLKFSKISQKIVPLFSRYNLKTKIVIKDSNVKELFFLQFLNKYKSNSNVKKGYSVYQIKLVARSFRVTPKMSPTTY